MADSESSTAKIRSKKPNKTKMIGNWHIGRTIGKGSSGHVRIARHAKTGEYAAVKIVSKHALVNSRMSMAHAGEEEDKILLAIEREIVIMKLIDHPNVLSLYDVWETKSELYLVMEYVQGGELFDYLVQRGRLPVAEAVHYFQQIINAVDYCHRFNIAHRDLKPENLLLDKDRNIKVADFGMAAWEGGDALLKTSCGSPHYASPEVVAGAAYHGSVSDIWSCGVILYALLAGRLPFDDDNVRVLLDKVRDGRFIMPHDIDPMAKDLLRRMLEKDVKKRITIPEILKHPFYLSRPLRPMKVPVIPPPSLEEVEKPVKSEDEIDTDIFRNLQILWHGAPDGEIIKALLSDEKTWEKAVYSLLMKYRLKQLENYNMDSDDAPDQPKKRAPPTKKPAPALPAPEPASKAAKPESLEPSPRQGTAELEVSSLPTTPKESDIPARPDAPTPRRATENPALESQSATPSATVKNTPTHVASTVPAQAIPTPSEPSTTSRQLPAVPAITLQDATPARPPPIQIDNNTRRVSNNSSHSATSTNSTSTRSSAAITTPLQVPLVGDETLQVFFKQIAEQLASIQAKQSSLSGGSPDLQALALAALNFAQNPEGGTAAFRSAVSAAAPPPTPLEGGFTFNEGNSRYEDAPEEAQDVQPNAARHNNNNNNHRSSVIEHPNAPYGLGIANYPEVSAPHRIVNGPRAQQPQYRHSGGPYHPPPTARRAATSPMPSQPARMRSYSQGSEASDKENGGPRGGGYGPNGGTRPRANSHHVQGGSNAEGLKPRSSIRSDGAPKRTPMGEKHVQIVLPQEDVMWAKQKRQSMYSEDSPYLSDTGSTATHSTAHSIFPSVPQTVSVAQKKSWFTNLFNFKPASYSLLSVYDPRITRDECRKLLRSFGVGVVLQNSEGPTGGILKCKLDEVRDPAGVMAVVKAVRFRVEFSHTSSSHAIAGYITSLTLVQEKGALSSFKLIFNRLRREWELDVPGGLLSTTNRSSQRNSYHAGQATLRLVPNHTGGSASSTGYTSSRSSGGAPSPALSSGGRFIESDYLSPIF